jgi:hypothetical protein
MVVALSYLRPSTQHLINEYKPGSRLGLLLKDAMHYLPCEAVEEILEELRSVAVIQARLFVTLFRADGTIEHKGMVSNKLLTNAGAGFIVDEYQNLVELENMKYHGIGTSTTAPAVGQTALVAELTTQYTGNVRATGVNNEASAMVLRSVATNIIDSGGPVSVQEFGLFDQAATGGGNMQDRALTGTQTLNNNDAIQTTYEFQIVPGS